MSAPISLKASGRGRRRLVVNRIAELAAFSAAIAAIVVLGILVWSVFSRWAKSSSSQLSSAEIGTSFACEAMHPLPGAA